jgi:ATP-dependent protease ClpP protease subunit
MITHLYSDITPEALNELINAINSLESKDFLNVYFTCPRGGDFDVARAMIDLINRNKDKIVLYCYGSLVSSGMYIYLWSECQKVILPDTRGMIHLPRMKVEIIASNTRSNSMDDFATKELDMSIDRIIDSLKGLGLTKKELKEIEEGKDVYFSYERILKINE